METMQRISESIYNGNPEEAAKHTKLELDKGTLWINILQKAMVPALDKIGQEFSDGIAFLPELIASGMAMKKAFEVIKEILGDIEIEPKATVVMGTIFDDHHDIGKNIVIMNLEGAGFKVIDLGVDVQPEVFIESCKEHKAHIVAISSLLSTTMWNLKTAIDKIREDGIDVIIMIGGNPITPQFAEEIGADGYAPDGYLAVKKAEELLGINQSSANFRGINEL